MGYIDFIISSFLFFTLFFSLVILINNKIVEIRKEKEIEELKIIAYKGFNKISEKLFNNLYFAIFNVSGSNTILLNFFVDCNWKINISSLRVFMNNIELPYSIENYNTCQDNSLSFVNISINLLYSVQNEKIFVFFSSGIFNQKNYSFQKVYSTFSSNFIGYGKKLMLNFYNLKNANYSELKSLIGKSFNIEVESYFFGEKEYGNIVSLNFPIIFFNDTIKEAELIFRVFE
ncbi:MAG: hypothetical protein QXQ14_03535 [Candidatus Aenigmatarchaeota archaeon]